MDRNASPLLVAHHTMPTMFVPCVDYLLHVLTLAAP
jgi:hypothetical protein